MRRLFVYICGWLAFGYVFIPFYAGANSTDFLGSSGTGAGLNNWINPSNAFTANGVYTHVIDVSNYADAVSLSWDSGSTWTSFSYPNYVFLVTDVEQVMTIGSDVDLWGRTWTDTEFSNANFRIRVCVRASGSTCKGGTEQDWENFNFGLPSGATIDGIEVQGKGYYTTGATYDTYYDYFFVAVHYTGGTTPPPEGGTVSSGNFQSWELILILVGVVFVFFLFPFLGRILAGWITNIDKGAYKGRRLNNKKYG
jgi:hypothetical protein